MQKLSIKVNGMSLRERQSLLAGLILAIPLLFWGTYLDGQMQKQQKIEKSTRVKKVEISKLEGLISGKGELDAADAGSANKTAQEGLRREIDTLRSSLSAANGALVTAERTPKLFEQIIKLRGPLHLVSVKTLPTASPARDSAAGTPGADVIVKHGVELILQGDTDALLLYLRKMESIPSPIFWDKATLRPGVGDKSTLTLSFHTLSLESSWITL